MTDLTNEKLQQILQNANIRSGACISLEHCLEQIESLSANEAITKLKDMLSKGEYEIEELQNHISILWVLHDIGRIQFPQQDYGMALSIQNIAKMEKAELASRLLGFLETNLTITD